MKDGFAAKTSGLRSRYWDRSIRFPVKVSVLFFPMMPELW